MLTWIFSWRYEAVKEDALQEGPPAPQTAVIRERVLGEMVKGPSSSPASAVSQVRQQMKTIEAKSII
jgi:hypothetical protein